MDASSDCQRIPPQAAPALSRPTGVPAEDVRPFKSLFRGRVPRKSTLRAELGPVPFLKKDAKHLF